MRRDWNLQGKFCLWIQTSIHYGITAKKSSCSWRTTSKLTSSSGVKLADILHNNYLTGMKCFNYVWCYYTIEKNLYTSIQCMYIVLLLCHCSVLCYCCVTVVTESCLPGGIYQNLTISVNNNQ